MKVGIITIHNPPNYGAMLQAYALSTYLRAQGHEAEIVDYDQPALREYFRFKWSFPPRLNNWLRIKRCAAFVRDKQVKSPKSYATPESFLADANNYDALITGSDQVWFTGPVQYCDPLYFLDLPDCSAKKLSYAASAGGTTDFGEFAPRIKAALSRYHAVAVRDDNTDALVQPLVDQATVRVVDPTFLIDFQELLSPHSPQPEPYLLLFGNIGPKWTPLVQAAAKRYGVKRIVTLQYKNTAATHRLGAPSPVDWINHFKHATAIVTTYFHGTAFAINFQKPFLSIPTPGRIQKVGALLDDVGLAERFINEKTDDPALSVDKLQHEIDWGMASALLKDKVEASKAFLRASLA